MSKKSVTAAFADDVPITQSDVDSGRLILRKRVHGKMKLGSLLVSIARDAGGQVRVISPSPNTPQEK